MREGVPLALRVFECVCPSRRGAGIIVGAEAQGRGVSDSEHLRLDIEEAEIGCPQDGKVPCRPRPLCDSAPFP